MYAHQCIAQIFPSFSTPIGQPNYQIDQGVSAAAVPNGSYGTVVMAVFANVSALNYAISADGQNYTYGIQVTPTVPAVDCNAGTPSTCGAAVAVFNGTIYVAYADSATHGLDVAVAGLVPNNVGYQWSLVHTDNSVQLTTSPAMSVSPDGSHLVIIFGTSNVSSVKNQFFEATLDASGNWTQASDGGNLGALSLSSASRNLLK